MSSIDTAIRRIDDITAAGPPWAEASGALNTNMVKAG